METCEAFKITGFKIVHITEAIVNLCFSISRTFIQFVNQKQSERFHEFNESAIDCYLQIYVEITNDNYLVAIFFEIDITS